MPWVKFLLMNITLVSWLESPLASKNPISCQGNFCLRNKCRKSCHQVGFIQNLRNAEIWGPRQHLLCSLVFGSFPLDPLNESVQTASLVSWEGFFNQSEKSIS